MIDTQDRQGKEHESESVALSYGNDGWLGCSTSGVSSYNVVDVFLHSSDWLARLA